MTWKTFCNPIYAQILSFTASHGESKGEHTTLCTARTLSKRYSEELPPEFFRYQQHKRFKDSAFKYVKYEQHAHNTTSLPSEEISVASC